jgi:uncharacterized protein YdeI (YjbR/CyaY-like superfamily)
MSRPTPSLQVTTREAWRAWLARHHATAREVWLVYAKRHTGEPRVEYDAAVEEALCFGWIDGLLRTVDDGYYAQRFTPRRPGSKWSALNRARFARMLRAGQVTEAGLANGPAASSQPGHTADPSALPPEFRRALRDHPIAWRNFAELAPSYRRLYVRWIATAKREETRARRITEAIGLLAAGKKLGLK